MQSIVIIEDISETRQWLCDIVHQAFPGADLHPVGSVRAAMSAINSTKFDLALVDLKLPDGDGLTILRRLAQSHPETLVIVTTVMASDSTIVAALSAGADGYLLKTESVAMMVHHLRQITSGVPALSPAIARRIMDHFRMTGPAAESESELTARETEVLSLVARGLRVADVATSLGVADTTIASHIKAIYRKLGINSRAEAALHASRLGLLG